jgi:hypothetical protein
VHLHVILTTLLGYPTGLFEKSLAECLHALSTVIAGIMNRGEFFVNGFVELDPSGLNVLFQEFMDGYDPDLIEYFWKPHLQTKPGREVSVASFGKE